jgi:hypothetical protein
MSDFSYAPDYMPVYFQAVLGSSPIHSGVQILGIALSISPFSLLSGIFVQKTKKYRLPNTVGWVVSIIAFGVFTLLKADSTEGEWVGYQIVMALGLGLIVSIA